MPRPSSPILVSAIYLVCVSHASASICASAAGVWTDSDGSIYTISQSPSGVLSGTIHFPTGTYCAVLTWNLSGQFLGNGQARIEYTNPNGASESPFCTWRVVQFHDIDKPGCHTGSAVWHSGWTPPPALPEYEGSVTWSKSCDVPSGESSSSNGWNATFPTAHNWLVTLAPSSTNFDGKTVSETGSTSDGCWFSGSAVAKLTTVGPSSADVLNNQYQDGVGWVPSAVTYYRSQSRAPCQATSVQAMHIDCVSSTPTYINNGLTLSIGVTTVTSARQGQSQTRTWP